MRIMTKEQDDSLLVEDSIGEHPAKRLKIDIRASITVVNPLLVDPDCYN